MSLNLKLGTLTLLLFISLTLCRGQSSATAYSYASSSSGDDDDYEAVPEKKIVVKKPEPEPEPEPQAKAVVIKEPEPEPEPECVFTPDFSTTEESLRSFIFAGNVEKAAAILSSNRTRSLAAGCSYNADEQCLVVQSEQRERDPDVVAFRAVALNALKTGEVQKLARVIVDSFTSDCQTCLFSSDELDDYTDGFVEFLSDKENLREVLEEDPSQDGTRRKLLVTEASPTNSFHCAYCYPNKACTTVRWCHSDD